MKKQYINIFQFIVAGRILFFPKYAIYIEISTFDHKSPNIANNSISITRIWRSTVKSRDISVSYICFNTSVNNLITPDIKVEITDHSCPADKELF